VCNVILFSHKKNEILSFVAIWIELDNIRLSEINQSHKGKYNVFSFVCGSLKKSVLWKRTEQWSLETRKGRRTEDRDKIMTTKI
jgi:hypothetical protein